MLALFVCGDAFTAEEKARDFEYYEALTVRDSSLSACCQAMIAAEVGHLDLAYDYFAEAALMDLEDLEHNTRDGIHIASVAGTWIAAVAGFGGMRDHGGQLSFSPRLPAALTRLQFRLMFRGREPAGGGRSTTRPLLVRGWASRCRSSTTATQVTVEPDKTLELADPAPAAAPRADASRPAGRPAKRRPPPRLMPFHPADATGVRATSTCHKN